MESRPNNNPNAPFFDEESLAFASEAKKRHQTLCVQAIAYEAKRHIYLLLSNGTLTLQSRLEQSFEDAHNLVRSATATSPCTLQQHQDNICRNIKQLNAHTGTFTESEGYRMAALMCVYNAAQNYLNAVQEQEEDKAEKYKKLQDIITKINSHFKEKEKDYKTRSSWMRDVSHTYKILSSFVGLDFNLDAYSASLSALCIMAEIHGPERDDQGRGALIPRGAQAMELIEQAKSSVAPKVHFDYSLNFEKQDILSALYLYLDLFSASKNHSLRKKHAEEIEVQFKRFANILKDNLLENSKFRSDPTVKSKQEELEQIIVESIQEILILKEGAEKEIKRSIAAHFIKSLLSCDLPLEKVITAIHKKCGDPGIKELYHIAMKHFEEKDPLQELFLMKLHAGIIRSHEMITIPPVAEKKGSLVLLTKNEVSQAQASALENKEDEEKKAEDTTSYQEKEHQALLNKSGVIRLLENYHEQLPSIIKITLAKTILLDACAASLSEKTLFDMLRHFPSEDKKISILSQNKGILQAYPEILKRSLALENNTEACAFVAHCQDLVLALETAGLKLQTTQNKETSLFSEWITLSPLFPPYPNLDKKTSLIAQESSTQSLQDFIRENFSAKEKISQNSGNILPDHIQHNLKNAALKAASLLKENTVSQATNLRSIIKSITTILINTHGRWEKMMDMMIEQHHTIAFSIYINSPHEKQYSSRVIYHVDLESTSSAQLDAIMAAKTPDQAYYFFIAAKKIYWGNKNSTLEEKEADEEQQLCSQKPPFVAAALLKNPKIVDWLLKDEHGYSETIEAVDVLFHSRFYAECAENEKYQSDLKAYKRTLNLFQSWAPEQLKIALKKEPIKWWLSWGALTNQKIVAAMSSEDLAKHLDPILFHLPILSLDHRVALIQQLDKKARLSLIEKLGEWENAKKTLCSGLKEKDKNAALSEIATALTHDFEQNDINTLSATGLLLSVAKYPRKVIHFLKNNLQTPVIRQVTKLIIDELEAGYLRGHPLRKRKELCSEIVKTHLYHYQDQDSPLRINSLIREEIIRSPQDFLENPALKYTLKAVLSDRDIVESLARKKEVFQRIRDASQALFEGDLNRAISSSYLQSYLAEGAKQQLLSIADLSDCIISLDAQKEADRGEPAAAAVLEEKETLNLLLCDLPTFIVNMSLPKDQLDITKTLLGRYRETYSDNKEKIQEMSSAITKNAKFSRQQTSILCSTLYTPRTLLEDFSSNFEKLSDSTSFLNMPLRTKITLGFAAVTLAGITLIPGIGAAIGAAIGITIVTTVGFVIKFSHDYPIITAIGATATTVAAAHYAQKTISENEKVIASTNLFAAVCNANKNDSHFINHLIRLLDEDIVLRNSIGKSISICRKHKYPEASYLTDSKLIKKMTELQDEYYYKQHPYLALITPGAFIKRAKVSKAETLSFSGKRSEASSSTQSATSPTPSKKDVEQSSSFNETKVNYQLYSSRTSTSSGTLPSPSPPPLTPR
ncbi:MAG: hypothetical protein K0S27_916 [Gammaproteobacteria bacterium]|jgi:hypothetical protein|nr:hypothetical protein [Gammaproteobacteria bacterium]